MPYRPFDQSHCLRLPRLQRQTAAGIAFYAKASALVMSSVKSCPLPADALLRRYRKTGFHTDCFYTDIPARVSQEQYVLAFYSTALFRLERFILKWAVSRPATDEQLADLALGKSNEFAAWSVEARTEHQLLMADFQGRTKSWLRNEYTETGKQTRLYFGSAVVPVIDKQSGEHSLGFVYKALLGFHKVYSMALLSAAAARLKKGR
ncbi:MAG: hypothetical protein RIA65_12775 [Woeseia sp.]